MNILRQREQLKELVKLHAISQRAAIEYAKSPVFVYRRSERLRPEENEWCQQNLCITESHLPVKLPFKVFTLICDWTVEQSVDNGVLRVWAHPFPFTDPNGDTQMSLLAFNFNIRVDGEDCLLRAKFTGEKTRGAICDMWRDGKPLFCKTEAHRQVVEEGLCVPREILMRFAFDVLNPASVVVRVDPPQTESRSVEWHMARRHYLVLNRSQALACREARRGPTEKEILRAAHWRRAHLRRLSSPKFTQKRGQLVFVKQAWVGPDEWCGLDGKIYKVQPTTV